MKLFKYLVLAFVVCAVLLAIGLGSKVWRWSNNPVPMTEPVVEFNVPKGSTIRSVAESLVRAGLDIEPQLFILYARYTGQDKLLKAGAYEVRQGMTPVDILTRLEKGDMIQRQIALIEGWTYKQIRQALKNNKDITQTLDDTSDEALLKKLGASETHLEGLFFPETYVFVPGDSDFEILRRAYLESQKRLMQAWEERDPDLPLKTPYEALILASIVEKETGHSKDRDRVSGVFINRLKVNMPLQTDPTVIYGMGDNYKGNISKKDLQTDTPWNTYTRSGLPPTPISSPGYLSLLAAVQPEKHKFYYFVARGDGTSEFAENLQKHNQNVRKFILKKGN
ncbi:MAG: endolytic transglycosylase MltG [Alcaligenaceae bacterium]|nr:endolytic transglycosylase MltG [Alcaligenaceae bacterium]